MKIKDKLKSINRFIGTSPSVLLVLLILFSLIFTFVLYPDKGKVNYSYKKGDVADRDIKASRDFLIEDKDATNQNKVKAAEAVPTVYDFDSGLSKAINKRVKMAFLIPGKFFLADNGGSDPSLSTVMTTKKDFEKAMGIPISRGAFIILFKNKFSDRIIEKILAIVSNILKNGVVANKELLLKEEGKGIDLRTIGGKQEKIVNNLKTFYGPDQAKTMVRIIGDPLLKGMDYNLANLIVDISQRLLRPNITINKSETDKRIRQAQSKIKPVLYKIKQGEMILREGDIVNDVTIMKLKAMENQITGEKDIFLARTGTALIIMFVLLVVYFLLLKNHVSLKKHHNKNIIFLSSMLILFLFMAKFAAPIAGSINLDLPFNLSSASIFMGLPMAAGSMTVCLFVNFDIALYFALVLSLFSSLIFGGCIEIFVFFFLSSTAAAYWVKGCKMRKGFITTGLKLSFFNACLAFSLNIYSAQSSIGLISKDSLLAFTGGIISGVITAGLAPLVEILFDYTSESKFLELSNLDQPIMKRLMIEAPGTYNHSVIVASLAEAAAEAIETSCLKTKVCALYHDIGKLDRPLYFIENQTDGKNRHDKLSPSMSALILIQHIKKGVEIAKKKKLGMDIVDTIQQHHGTSLIRYFYNKSIKINGKDAVNEDDFRYPGPKPQTRVAGIVMLADVVEAALRTLERPTSARIQGRVQELINAIFADGQLEECELTLKDLHHIAKSFNKILTGIYHHRIEYSDKQMEKKKEKNEKPENFDSDSSDRDKNIKKQDKQKNPANLKRLGI